MTTYRVKVSALRPGDVLFVTNPYLPGMLVGLLIRLGDSAIRGMFRKGLSRFSHVALHLDRGVLIEATKAGGVRMRALTPLDYFRGGAVEIRRPTQEFFDDAQRVAALQAGASQFQPFLFREYGRGEAVLSVFPAIAELNERLRGRDRFFCSKLVARIFADLGFPIAEGRPESVTPLELHLSKKLERIDDREVLARVSSEMLRRLGNFLRPWYGRRASSSEFDGLQDALRAVQMGETTEDQFEHYWESVVARHAAQAQEIERTKAMTVELVKHQPDDFRAELTALLGELAAAAERDCDGIRSEYLPALEEMRAKGERTTRVLDRLEALEPDNVEGFLQEIGDSLRRKGHDADRIKEGYAGLRDSTYRRRFRRDSLQMIDSSVRSHNSLSRVADQWEREAVAYRWMLEALAADEGV